MHNSFLCHWSRKLARQSTEFRCRREKCLDPKILFSGPKICGMTSFFQKCLYRFSLIFCCRYNICAERVMQFSHQYLLQFWSCCGNTGKGAVEKFGLSRSSPICFINSSKSPIDSDKRLTASFFSINMCFNTLWGKPNPKSLQKEWEYRCYIHHIYLWNVRMLNFTGC